MAINTHIWCHCCGTNETLRTYVKNYTNIKHRFVRFYRSLVWKYYEVCLIMMILLHQNDGCSRHPLQCFWCTESQPLLQNLTWIISLYWRKYDRFFLSCLIAIVPLYPKWDHWSWYRYTFSAVVFKIRARDHSLYAI